MKCKILTGILGIVLLVFSQFTLGQVRLPRLVSSGMVLQRETPLKIWGWAGAGEKVKLSFKNKTYDTTSSIDGKWLITLPSQHAGGPFEMQISSSNQIKLENILIGDVWLCSGQSNMELPMRRVAVLYSDDMTASQNTMIRQFQVPVRWNFVEPQFDLQGGKWEEANPQTIVSFSAVGYFFARDLYSRYKIPIGLINCAAGGSSAESWISKESLKAFPAQFKIAGQLSDTGYLHDLISSEQKAFREWFGQLAKMDLGRKGIPWFNPSLEDASWKTVRVPVLFEETDMGKNCGVVWCRREFELPENYTAKEALLELGRIVDSDSVFINGQIVGNTSYQYPPRRYQVPHGILKAGKNNITVRIVSQSFMGGFIPDKPYQLDVDGQTFDLKGDWKYNIGAKCGPSPVATFFPGKPLGLFNAMLYPIINYQLKGMAWYQGESNTERAADYKLALSTLIGEWRNLWGQGNLPFLFVQLPDFMASKKEPSEGDWATLRYQQLKTLSVPNTGMVVTIGLGEWNDIHPLRKKEVGQRLALAAGKLAYGDIKTVSSGPIYQSMKVTGSKIELTFSNCGGGLVSSDGKDLNHFAIAGADKKYYWAKAEIVENKIIVSNEKVLQPQMVRYAWADNPAGANLGNREGLPASPFSTE